MMMIWVCRRCNAFYNPGPKDIPRGEYVMIDMSKNDFECLRCRASRNVITR